MAATLDEARSLSDPARQFNFDVTITPPAGAGVDAEILQLRATSSIIPGFGSEITEVNLGKGHVIGYAGRGEYPREWSVTLVEGEDTTVYNNLEDWHQLQWDRETGNSQPSDQYKTEVIIDLLAGDGSSAKQFRLDGAFIQNVGDSTLDKSSSEALTVELTLRFDRVIPI